MGGIFQSFVDWLVWIVDKLYGFTVTCGFGSYALAIIILTVIVKMALYPLSRSQMRSTKKMQDLQPRMEEIRRKYKNKDPEKMNRLIMELYKENNASPFAGCLPLLIQFPVLIGLYRALLSYNYLEPADAGFFWIPSLTATDPYYILPILAAVFTYLQSKVSMTNSGDKTQKIMLIVMPFMLAWITATVPSGLGLYWVTFSIAGIVQQIYINRQVAREKAADAAAAALIEKENPKAGTSNKKASGQSNKTDSKKSGSKDELKGGSKSGTKSGTKNNKNSSKKGQK